jgi:uncharacterized protein (TIGR03437 family)
VSVNVSGGFLVYSAQSNVSWLKVTSNTNPIPSQGVSGSANSVMNVYVDPSTLSAGIYNGLIAVTAGSSTVNLPVTFTVSQTTLLTAQPNALTYTFQTGGTTPAAQTLTIATTGLPLSFTATAVSSGWLSVSPNNGATNGVNVLTVSVNPAGLALGTYNGSISIVSGTTTLTVPVSLSVGTGTPSTITANPQSMTFQAPVGSVPTAQILTLSSLVSQSFFLIADTAGSGWLRATPDSGSTPATITVTVDPSLLTSPGVYAGTISIRNLSDNSQLTIPVTMTVAPGAISATPQNLNFNLNQGANATQAIQLAGAGSTSFSATTGAAWLAVSPSSGNIPATVNVTASAANLAPGLYAGTVTITGGGATLAINVGLTVSSNTLSASPSNVTLTYSLGSATLPTASISVTSSVTGLPFSLTARTDSGGNWLVARTNSSTTPAQVTVTVEPADLSAGTYRGIVTLTSGAGDQRTVQVNLTVLGNPAPSIRTILNGATLQPTTLAPGLIVMVQGSNLGPTTGVTATVQPAGAILNVLSNVRLLFDGVPAPVLFVRNDQINAVVPYAVANRSTSSVRAEVNGQLSSPIELRVSEAAPGLFTVDGSGLGQAAALNEDGLRNGPNVRARRGTVVSLFATGEGITAPDGQDGRIINTDLRRPRLPVRVFAGGVPLEVLYAGSAPGLISGAFQINVLISNAVTPGTAVPVELQVGPTRSGSAATIAVE